MTLLRAARSHQLHSGRGPGERTGLRLGEWREKRKRISPATAGEAGEILVSLTHRHRHHIGRDAGGKNQGLGNRCRRSAFALAPPGEWRRSIVSESRVRFGDETEEAPVKDGEVGEADVSGEFDELEESGEAGELGGTGEARKRLRARQASPGVSNTTT